ncbi:MAG: tetratricopeptide repeat protein [Deltaproteobacteria bacterium]|nr:tetratricopeptide repeat protein [Deltaproteobacteria bacterium]
MSIAGTARLKILIGIGLSILVLVCYRGVVENDFIRFDDPQYVMENPWVQRGLSGEAVVWAFTTSSYASNWHPLTWLSLLLDRALFGMNPAGYHWTSVLLHLFGGLLLFGALSRMTASLWRSALVAALFLIHPLHVESVAWVAERKDVLSGLFWMTGLWCYARYAERPGLVRYLWVVLSFVCGLLSKPMVVTFPFVLLLLDWWPLGRTAGGKASWTRLVWEKIPLFLLSAAGSVITFLIQRKDHAVVPLSAMSLDDRLANAAMSYAAYLGKTLWPAGLSIFYPYHGPPPLGHLLFAVALIILITGISVLLSNRRPYLLVGWLWYLGTLVPVIGLVQVGSQAIADRYTYLPLVGVFIMVAWGAKDLLGGSRGRRAIWSIVSIAVVVVLVVLTQIQVGHWKDNFTLFSHALRNTERNFMAHHILAEGMSKAGDLAGAEKHHREAIRIKPAFKQAYNGLGYLLMIRGKQDEAAPLLEKALQIDPTFVLAMKNLGDVRMRQRRIEDAISIYRKAVILSEEDPELLNNYGVALFFKGEKEEAVLKIRAALRLKPDYAEARDNLRKILGRGKDVELTQEQDRVKAN